MHDADVVQTTHPVLIALVRLLAREAAAACLEAKDCTSPFLESSDEENC